MCIHTLLALLERMDVPILDIPSQASSANSPRVGKGTVSCYHSTLETSLKNIQLSQLQFYAH